MKMKNGKKNDLGAVQLSCIRGHQSPLVDSAGLLKHGVIKWPRHCGIGGQVLD